MGILRSIARAAFTSMAVAEGGAALVRFDRRKCQFQAAAVRAAKLGRRLIVVGNPDGGFHTRFLRAYGCGDVCVDLLGCPSCPVTVVADLTQGPVPGIADDSAVVFVSCVLEYVGDLDRALAEIARIGGHPDNIFIVTVQPWTLTARLYPGARWRGELREGAATMKPLTHAEKFTAAALVGGLAAAALWPSNT